MFENVDLLKQRYLKLPLGKRILLTIAVFLIAIQLVISFFFGGDAFQGREVNGHFFLKAHGNSPEHEVSARFFYADLWLVRAIGCLWLVGIILGTYEQMRVSRAKKSN